MTEYRLKVRAIDHSFADVRSRTVKITGEDAPQLVLILTALLEEIVSSATICDPVGARLKIKLDKPMLHSVTMTAQPDTWIVTASAMELDRWRHFLTVAALGTPTVDHIDVIDEQADEDLHLTIAISGPIISVSGDEARRRLLG